MKNLRKFNNILDITSKISPHVYFISDGTIESNDIYINNFPFSPVKLFDILYSDARGNLLYTSKILPASEGKIPIALCIAPEGFFGTGEKARWMSLKYMNYNTPDTGALTVQKITFCGNSVNLSYLQNYSTTYMGVNSLWGNFTASWITSSDTKIPSLIDNNSNWNLTDLGDVNTYIATDIDGKTHTNLILLHANGLQNWRTDLSIINSTDGGVFPAVCCCTRYHTLGTLSGDWYLGASGENAIMIHYTPEINDKLQQISAIYPNDCITQIQRGTEVYWTSTHASTYFADIFFNNYGQNAGIGYALPFTQYGVIALLQY